MRHGFFEKTFFKYGTMRHGFNKQKLIDSTLYYSIIFKFFKNQQFTRMQQEIRSELRKRTDLTVNEK